MSPSQRTLIGHGMIGGMGMAGDNLVAARLVADLTTGLVAAVRERESAAARAAAQISTSMTAGASTALEAQQAAYLRTAVLALEVTKGIAGAVQAHQAANARVTDQLSVAMASAVRNRELKYAVLARQMAESVGAAVRSQEAGLARIAAQMGAGFSSAVRGQEQDAARLAPLLAAAMEARRAADSDTAQNLDLDAGWSWSKAWAEVPPFERQAIIIGIVAAIAIMRHTLAVLLDRTVPFNPVAALNDALLGDLFINMAAYLLGKQSR